MSDVDWYAARAEIVRLLNANKSLLAKEDVDYVTHYIAVDEYEMALEILCLALMHKPEVSLADLEAMGVVAQQIGLDKESVYDSDFWTNFTAALEKRRQRGGA
jgi:hypothetical protein